MKLSIHLVTWNGAKYIPHLFASLRSQTYKDWRFFILDNNSSDGTVEAIKKELNNLGVQHQLIENQENLGFAGGHNKLLGFIHCHSERSEESFKDKERDPSTSASLRSAFVQDDKIEYILLLNQDIYLMPDCLEKLVKFMDEYPDTAAISPRLMKWNFSACHSREACPRAASGSGNPGGFTDQIDSLGLKVLKSRRVVELGAGEKWLAECHSERSPKGEVEESLKFQRKGSLANAQDDVAEVFGVSGALPMFRKSAIDIVGLFDDSFGSYKEDVDLAFRLRSAGWKAYCVLNAVAYHDRSASGLSDLSDKFALENKKKQSELIKYNSYRNHLMTLIKNEYWQNYLLDLPWIKWYELKKFLYFLLFDGKVLKGLGEIIKRLKDLKIKRLEIKELRKVGWREMRKWWG